MKHLKITVHGKVQGVFFRASTKAVADQLGVKGTVRNQKDGTVLIDAEGDQFSLDSLLDFCKSGPNKAEVDKVEFSEEEFKGYKNFEVVRKS